MVKQLIPAGATLRKLPNSPDCLEVSEFFYDSIQGEGINIGMPAAFLRLQGCTLDCTWCDTQEVWRYGNPYSFDELFELIETPEHIKDLDYGYSLLDKLRCGQHLVITGGSPLKQQINLTKFVVAFEKKYGFHPYIEIENECTIMPNIICLPNLIDCWNNSPKLSSSGNKIALRYKPEVLNCLRRQKNSWFKFVICDETDWKEIQMDFLDQDLIFKNQIILMPMGETKVELERNRPIALEMAIKHNVRFTDRLHITIWDKKTGV